MALSQALKLRLFLLIPVVVDVNRQGASGLDCWFCTTDNTNNEPELSKLANNSTIFNACEPGTLPSTAVEHCPLDDLRYPFMCGIFYYPDMRNKNNKIPISRRCIQKTYSATPAFTAAQPLFCYTWLNAGPEGTRYSCICSGDYCNNFPLAAIGIAVDNTNLSDSQRKPIPAGSSLSPNNVAVPGSAGSASGSTGSATGTAGNTALQSVAGNKESGDRVAASGQSPTSAGKGGSTKGSSNAATGSKGRSFNVICHTNTMSHTNTMYDLSQRVGQT
ncbi:uncharacterized protein LOC129595383 [Paramacrobiotus metropolitanus]|uniref:uncharacterized protein LOC129595383 n=1 Tax=Paramacrobiotus metropolitanus TaxID=2943436 RepID=UPI00244645D3|nr:uncharacterized protein LOC129595383 [Paramacrobiotus metropolitanus]